MKMSLPDPSLSDPEACTRAFEGEVDYVYRTLRRHGVDASDLDDVCQETFIVMWRTWARYDRSRPLRPWLAGIAFRVARNHLRRKRPEILQETLEHPDEAGDAEDALVSRQAADRASALVTHILASLPEKLRVAFVLHELDGLPIKEVAQLLEVPVPTAYTRLWRARHAFSKRIAQLRDDGGSGGEGKLAWLPAAVLLDRARAIPPLSQAIRRAALDRAPRATRGPETIRASSETAPRSGTSRPEGRPQVGTGTGGVARLGRWSAALAVSAAALVALLWLPGGRASALHSTVTFRLLGTASTASAGNARGPVAVPGPHLIVPPATEPTPADHDPHPDWLGSWTFDGPAGPQARDDSGHGHDCLIHDGDPAAVWREGHRGGGADLAGQAWLECPLPDTDTGHPMAMTVAAWVKLHSRPDRNVAVATRQIETGFRDLFFLGFTATGVRVTSHAWGALLDHPMTFELDHWFHIAFTHDLAGVTRLYVDGHEVARTSGPAQAFGHVRSSLTLGAGQFSRSPSNVRQRLDGEIDDVEVFDRALGGERIAGLAEH